MLQVDENQVAWRGQVDLLLHPQLLHDCHHAGQWDGLWDRVLHKADHRGRAQFQPLPRLLPMLRRTLWSPGAPHCRAARQAGGLEWRCCRGLGQPPTECFSGVSQPQSRRAGALHLPRLREVYHLSCLGDAKSGLVCLLKELVFGFNSHVHRRLHVGGCGTVFSALYVLT